MASTVRVALFGFGYWGPNLLRVFAERPDTRVVGLADPDPARRAEARQRRAGLELEANHRAFLQRADIDAVAIATPVSTHGALVREALAAGKHVFVEKPLGTDAAAAEELAQLAERNGLVLMVGHTFLYSTPVRRLRQRIRDGSLGELVHIHAERLNFGRVQPDVDALWSLAPHDVSILLYLLERMPERVAARGLAHLRGVADVVSAELHFGAGPTAVVHWSWMDPCKVRRLTCIGRRGMAVYDDVDSHVPLVLYAHGAERLTGAGRAALSGPQADIDLRSTPLPEPLAVECQHFLDCIRTRSTALSDGRFGARVVRVLVALQTSMREGGRDIRIA
jgi:predicted dehydrogenase